MNSVRLLPRVAFYLSLAVCASSRGSDSTSPRLADSPKAQRDRDLTLIGGNSSSHAERIKAVLRTLAELRQQHRETLAAIDRHALAASKDPAVLETLYKVRDATLRNIGMLEVTLERLTKESALR